MQTTQKKIKPNSVRMRAAVLIIAIVLVTTVFATVTGIYFSSREISKTIEQDLILVGELASDMIRSSFGTIDEGLRYVGFNMGMECFGPGGNLADANISALQAALDNEVENGPSFISLAVAFSDGRLIASARSINEDALYALPDKSKIEEYFSKAPPFQPEVFFMARDTKIDETEMTGGGHYVIRGYISISDDAVFIGTLRGEYFSHLISTSNYGVYNAGKIFLVDSGRTVIAHTGQESLEFPRIDQDDGNENKNKNDLASVVTSALESTGGQSAIARYTDENGMNAEKTVSLLSTDDVERSNILSFLDRVKIIVTGTWFIASLIIFTVLFSVYIAVRVIQKRKNEPKTFY